jgi:hypothetical protein
VEAFREKATMSSVSPARGRFWMARLVRERLRGRVPRGSWVTGQGQGAGKQPAGPDSQQDRSEELALASPTAAPITADSCSISKRFRERSTADSYMRLY